MYLVVVMISADSYGVHDELAAFLVAGSAVVVVRVVFCSEVMAQLMSGHQVRFLQSNQAISGGKHVVKNEINENAANILGFENLHCKSTLSYCVFLLSF